MFQLWATSLYNQANIESEKMNKSKNSTPNRGLKQSDLMALLQPDDIKGHTEERIAKTIAKAGLCSRRDAERWIEQGRVEINGQILESPAYNVAPQDKIRVNGKILAKPEALRLWRYYKPRGLVVSHKDEKGRSTIFENLPEHLPRVVSIGRLDLDSEGLILLTNLGSFARHLELPDTGWSRKYRVRVRGIVDAEKLKQLAGGITIEGVHYRGITATLDRQQNSNAWLSMTLREGKNREIRKIMEHMGYRVSRLIRTSYGPFQLGQLEEGKTSEVSKAVLRDQLGLPQKKKENHAHHQRQKSRRSS